MYFDLAKFPSKVMGRASALEIVRTTQSVGKTVVFTNGCFDLLHAGHVSLLNRARLAGDYLVVGLNSDYSVKKNKGEHVPIILQDHRACVLAGLEAVDAVVIFEERTPLDLITFLTPDVLVKGDDWPLGSVVGSEVVRRHGGRVMTLSNKPGASSSLVISKIKKLPLD